MYPFSIKKLNRKVFFNICVIKIYRKLKNSENIGSGNITFLHIFAYYQEKIVEKLMKKITQISQVKYSQRNLQLKVNS